MQLSQNLFIYLCIIGSSKWEYSVCVCYGGVGVTTHYDETTTDADITVIAAVIGGSIGGLVIVMVVIVVGVMIAVVLNMRKKQLKHDKCYRSTLYSFLLMYYTCYLLQVVETALMMLQI